MGGVLTAERAEELLNQIRDSNDPFISQQLSLLSLRSNVVSTSPQAENDDSNDMNYYCELCNQYGHEMLRCPILSETTTTDKKQVKKKEEHVLSTEEAGLMEGVLTDANIQKSFFSSLGDDLHKLESSAEGPFQSQLQQRQLFFSLLQATLSAMNEIIHSNFVPPKESSSKTESPDSKSFLVPLLKKLLAESSGFSSHIISILSHTFQSSESNAPLSLRHSPESRNIADLVSGWLVRVVRNPSSSPDEKDKALSLLLLLLVQRGSLNTALNIADLLSSTSLSEETQNEVQHIIELIASLCKSKPLFTDFYEESSAFLGLFSLSMPDQSDHVDDDDDDEEETSSSSNPFLFGRSVGGRVRVGRRARALRGARLFGESSKDTEKESKVSSCITTDGSFLYILSPLGLAKVGSGENGTLRGHFYAFNKSITEGTIAYVHASKSLFYRGPSSAQNIDVLDQQTLEVSKSIALSSDLRLLSHSPIVSTPHNLFIIGRSLDSDQEFVAVKLHPETLIVISSTALLGLNFEIDEKTRTVTRKKIGRFRIACSGCGKFNFSGKAFCTTPSLPPSGSFTVLYCEDCHQAGLSRGITMYPVTATDMTTVDQPTWSSVTAKNQPSARWGHTATYFKLSSSSLEKEEKEEKTNELKSCIVLFGGASGQMQQYFRAPVTVESTYDDVYVYDIVTSTFFKPSCSGEGPTPRLGHTASAWKKNLVIFGGGKDDSGEEVYNDLYLLDTETWEWSKPTMSGTIPDPRCFHAALLVGDYLIIHGGKTADKVHNDIHVLDLRNMRWSAFKTSGILPPNRWGHVLFLTDEDLLCIGGSATTSSSGLPQYRLEGFASKFREAISLFSSESKPKEDDVSKALMSVPAKWATATKQQHYHVMVCAAFGVYENKLYVVGGGRDSSFTQQTSVLNFSTSDYTWSSPQISGVAIPPMAAAAACIAESQFFVFGGADHSGALDRIFVLELAADPSVALSAQCLEKASFYSNGEHLHVVIPPQVVPNVMSGGSHIVRVFSLQTGSFCYDVAVNDKRQSLSSPQAKGPNPGVVCYDAVNNICIAYDYSKRCVRRWLNKSPSPLVVANNANNASTDSNICLRFLSALNRHALLSFSADRDDYDLETEQPFVAEITKDTFLTFHRLLVKFGNSLSSHTEFESLRILLRLLTLNLYKLVYTREFSLLEVQVKEEGQNVALSDALFKTLCSLIRKLSSRGMSSVPTESLLLSVYEALCVGLRYLVPNAEQRTRWLIETAFSSQHPPAFQQQVLELISTRLGKQRNVSSLFLNYSDKEGSLPLRLLKLPDEEKESKTDHQAASPNALLCNKEFVAAPKNDNLLFELVHAKSTFSLATVELALPSEKPTTQTINSKKARNLRDALVFLLNVNDQAELQQMVKHIDAEFNDLTPESYAEWKSKQVAHEPHHPSVFIHFETPDEKKQREEKNKDKEAKGDKDKDAKNSLTHQIASPDAACLNKKGNVLLLKLIRSQPDPSYRPTSASSLQATEETAEEVGILLSGLKATGFQIAEREIELTLEMVTKILRSENVALFRLLKSFQLDLLVRVASVDDANNWEIAYHLSEPTQLLIKYAQLLLNDATALVETLTKQLSSETEKQIINKLETSFVHILMPSFVGFFLSMNSPVLSLNLTPLFSEFLGALDSFASASSLKSLFELYEKAYFGDASAASEILAEEMKKEASYCCSYCNDHIDSAPELQGHLRDKHMDQLRATFPSIKDASSKPTVSSDKVLPTFFKAHWLLDLIRWCAVTCGKHSALMIAGPESNEDEQNLQPWFNSTLFDGGLEEPAFCSLVQEQLAKFKSQPPKTPCSLFDLFGLSIQSYKDQTTTDAAFVEDFLQGSSRSASVSALQRAKFVLQLGPRSPLQSLFGSSFGGHSSNPERLLSIDHPIVNAMLRHAQICLVKHMGVMKEFITFGEQLAGKSNQTGQIELTFTEIPSSLRRVYVALNLFKYQVLSERANLVGNQALPSAHATAEFFKGLGLPFIAAEDKQDDNSTDPADEPLLKVASGVIDRARFLMKVKSRIASSSALSTTSLRQEDSEMDIPIPTLKRTHSSTHHDAVSAEIIAIWKNLLGQTPVPSSALLTKPSLRRQNSTNSSSSSSTKPKQPCYPLCSWILQFLRTDNVVNPREAEELEKQRQKNRSKGVLESEEEERYVFKSEVMLSSLLRQLLRARSRLFGFQQLERCLSSVHFLDSAKHELLRFFSSALRGDTTVFSFRLVPEEKKDEKVEKPISGGLFGGMPFGGGPSFGSSFANVFNSTFANELRNSFNSAFPGQFPSLSFSDPSKLLAVTNKSDKSKKSFHFADGCDLASKTSLSSAFRSIFMHICNLLHEQALLISDPSKPPFKELALTLLCATGINFKASDHDFLDESGVIHTVHRFMELDETVKERKQIRDAAWASFRLLSLSAFTSGNTSADVPATESEALCSSALSPFQASVLHLILGILRISSSVFLERKRQEQAQYEKEQKESEESKTEVSPPSNPKIFSAFTGYEQEEDCNELFESKSLPDDFPAEDYEQQDDDEDDSQSDDGYGFSDEHEEQEEQMFGLEQQPFGTGGFGGPEAEEEDEEAAVTQSETSAVSKDTALMETCHGLLKLLANICAPSDHQEDDNPILTYLSSEEVNLLPLLFSLLHNGSPRIQRVVARLMRRLLPLENPTGLALESELYGTHSIPEYLLQKIGTLLCVQPPNAPSSTTLRSSFYVPASVLHQFACELIALVRVLLSSPEWKSQFEDLFITAMETLPSLLKDSILQEESQQLIKLEATLAILGGVHERIRVGGRVEVINSRNSKKRKTAIVLAYSQLSGDARVVYEGAAVKRVETVPRGSLLLPIDEIPLAIESVTFVRNSVFIRSFLTLLIDLTSERKELLSLAAQRLRTHALKSLATLVQSRTTAFTYLSSFGSLLTQIASQELKGFSGASKTEVENASRLLDRLEDAVITNRALYTIPSGLSSNTDAINFDKQAQQLPYNPYNRVALLPCSMTSENNLLVFENESKTVVCSKGSLMAYEDECVAVSSLPIPSNLPTFYFEVKLLSRGSDGCLQIGLYPQGKTAKGLPGRMSGSLGMNDGSQLEISRHHHSVQWPNNASQSVHYWQDGDIIGIMINRLNGSISLVHNGVIVEDAARFTSKKPLLVGIGISAPGARLEVNFGAVPFRFDWARSKFLPKELRSAGATQENMPGENDEDDQAEISTPQTPNHASSFSAKAEEREKKLEEMRQKAEAKKTDDLMGALMKKKEAKMNEEKKTEEKQGEEKKAEEKENKEEEKAEEEKQDLKKAEAAPASAHPAYEEKESEEKAFPANPDDMYAGIPQSALSGAPQIEPWDEDSDFSDAEQSDDEASSSDEDADDDDNQQPQQEYDEYGERIKKKTKTPPLTIESLKPGMLVFIKPPKGEKKPASLSSKPSGASSLNRRRRPGRYRPVNMEKNSAKLRSEKKAARIVKVDQLKRSALVACLNEDEGIITFSSFPVSQLSHYKPRCDMDLVLDLDRTAEEQLARAYLLESSFSVIYARDALCQFLVHSFTIAEKGAARSSSVFDSLSATERVIIPTDIGGVHALVRVVKRLATEEFSSQQNAAKWQVIEESAESVEFASRPLFLLRKFVLQVIRTSSEEEAQSLIAALKTEALDYLKQALGKKTSWKDAASSSSDPVLLGCFLLDCLFAANETTKSTKVYFPKYQAAEVKTAAKTIAHVYTIDIYDALTNILNPLKKMKKFRPDAAFSVVLPLLCKLLSKIEQFQESPDLSKLTWLEDRMRARYAEEQKAAVQGSALTVSRPLQLMANLLLLLRAASNRSKDSGSLFSDVLLQSESDPSKWFETVEAVTALLKGLDKGQGFPVQFLRAAWLDMYAQKQSITIESSHPYTSCSSEWQKHSIPNSVALNIKLDPKCSTEASDKLKFAVEGSGSKKEIALFSGPRCYMSGVGPAIKQQPGQGQQLLVESDTVFVQFEVSQSPAHPQCFCKHCDFPIKGTRYVCGSCDGNDQNNRFYRRHDQEQGYNLCEACEKNNYDNNKHERTHVFVAIKRPLPFNTLVPKNVPAPSSLYTKEQLKNIRAGTLDEAGSVHTGITCSVCHTTNIVGTRFKCGYCLDFNMCAKCEQSGIHHDRSHPLLKLRFPVQPTAQLNGIYKSLVDNLKDDENYWGYKVNIIPQYPDAFQERLLKEHESELESIQKQLPHETNGEASKEINIDSQAVELVNRAVNKLLTSGTEDKRSNRRRRDRFGSYLANESKVQEGGEFMALNISPSTAVSSYKDLAGYTNLVNLELESVQMRIALLRLLNKKLSSVLPLIDWSRVHDDWSLSNIFGRLRGLIFSQMKMSLWQSALAASQSRGGHGAAIELDNLRAAQARELANELDPLDVTEASMFGQMHSQLSRVPANTLRTPYQPWQCRFTSEAGIDVGGLFRDSLSQACQELSSDYIPLFIPSPNSRSGVGITLDKIVPNPRLTGEIWLSMYNFLGRLFGVAIRTNTSLDIALPSIIWKPLVGQDVEVGDLQAIDELCISNLNAILDDKALLEKGIDESSFEDVYGLTFTYPSADGSIHELKENGSQIPVTWQNRLEFATLVVQFRLQEFAPQVQALRQGLCSVIPARFLSLLTWKELELEVCGNPEIDIDVLKQNTKYTGCSPTDPHIKYFWAVMESFSQQERAQFLRFVWGRSKLPPAGKFTEKMKIDSTNISTDHLPKAHTCFFSLELPKYQSEEIMRDKLIKAITLCASIDLV